MTVQLSEPTVVQREPQTYVGVTATVTMETIAQVAPRLFAEVVDWARSRGAMRGAPIMRYLVIDMDRELDIEVGVPVDPDFSQVLPGDRLHRRVLPGGRYLTAVHTGPDEQLVAATGLFLDKGRAMNVEFDVTAGSRGDVWASRVEEYLTDPAEQPDRQKHETLLAFKLVD